MYERIIVPLDGSPLAERALPHAERLAALVAAPIHLVRVIDATKIERRGGFSFGLEPATDEQALVTEESAALGYIGSIERRLLERGVGVTEEVRRGAVAQEICAAANPRDLIVMASHGRGGVTRWFVGSVAEDVVRRATVPVLLVRAEHDAPA
jgi:nucleotide-binding universal stress UspA family protein